MARTIGDFKAYPTHFQGERAVGTSSHPGFHTAKNFDAAIPYAQMKFKKDLHDYPVIVALDMSGLIPEPDYDAKTAWETLDVILQDFKRYLDGTGHDEQVEAGLFDLFYNYTEGMYDSESSPIEKGDDVLPALFALTASDPSNLGYMARDLLESFGERWANHTLWLALQGKIDTTFAMNVIGQFRYLEDISSIRIVQVSYIMPWWDEIMSEHEFEEASEDMQAIEDAGFNILTEEDVWAQVLNTQFVDTRIIRPSDGDRVEYHGTSYINLISAAPELIEILPVPPTLKSV